MATSPSDAAGMTRRHATTLALDVVLTIVGALVLLTAWHAVVLDDRLAGFLEGARLLFLFMDVGLGAWIVALVVLGMRARRGRPRPGRVAVLVACAIGVVVNAAAVLVIGLAQGVVYLDHALLAGAATLVAAFAVVPALHRARDAQPSAAGDPAEPS
ncbi:hypothetical protein [Agrococcus jejuensis]|uniref:Uncharacterized protein n=1 Tax=Agrococcus jejuensis TaxID=399736 RepID=A0A1G8FZ45_9MICO|nr:hypothetical protein [Agrococcus jejuensis]SDH87236.1 hypothetical protein SAMN04489720_2678 [Agrococcus jejuensis]